MPVYMNTSDTLKDVFEREVKANNCFFDPMILSEWIYDHKSDPIIEKRYPKLMYLLKKVTKIVPEASQADIIAELISVANKMFNEQYSEKIVNKRYKEWIKRYLNKK